MKSKKEIKKIANRIFEIELELQNGTESKDALIQEMNSICEKLDLVDMIRIDDEVQKLIENS